MDTNFLLTILLPVIFIILILEFDEAMLLFIIGFIAIVIAFNFDNIFEMTSMSYSGFGLIMKYIFWFIPIFTFVKTYFTAKDFGFLSRGT